MTTAHRITRLDVALLVLGAGLLAACSSRVPARVETVNGHQVEIATAGAGGVATVVFEAGLGDDWTPWDQVASEVALHTRVFAYSRPGYGASDPATSPRDPKQIVEELRTLLASQGYAPPFLLVGHSMGGTYMELFAKSHPDEVLGVVLVDPRHRDFLGTCEAAKLDQCGIPEEILASQAPSEIAEYHAFTMASEEIRAAGPFGPYPVRVLTATNHPVSPAREALWETMLASLAAEAVNGEQIIVQGSGHYVQLDRPAEVVKTILAFAASDVALTVPAIPTINRRQERAINMTNVNATSLKIPGLRHACVALVLILSSAIGAEGAAFAEMDTVVATPAAAATLEPPTASPPYSLPWQLRPVTIGNVVRVDSAAAAFNDANGNLDIAVATVLAASYQLTPNWAPVVRLGFVGNNAPGAALDGSSFVNPMVGATYARRMGSYRLALFGATTIPIGTGGGNAPGVGAAKTNAASVTARPADDAMLAVNYLTEIVGADFAYVNHGFTAQGEATLLQFVRVRGGDSAAATDSFRTGSVLGLHLGYFMGSHFSLSADLRYQRWLSHPTTLNTMTGVHVPFSDASMDTVTVAAGPRLHFRLGKHAGIHPGLSFVRGLDARGLDAPLITAQTTAVQLDIPVTF